MDWTDRLFGFKTGAKTLAYAIEYAEGGFNLRTDFYGRKNTACALRWSHACKCVLSPEYRLAPPLSALKFHSLSQFQLLPVPL